MKKDIKNLIKMALYEDLGSGDITSEAVIEKRQQAKARVIAKESGIVAGLPLARIVFEVADPKIRFKQKAKDGHKVQKGKIIAELSGPARSILAGERLALNFLQRLSGIATLTRKYVDKVKGTKVKILDTRKTIPLWRGADKYAVCAGGGYNHRMGLYDAVLIKDNHIAIAGEIKKAVVAAKLALPKKLIEAEAKKLSQVKQAIRAGADIILLDNMNIKALRQAVRLCKKSKVKTEASGGVNLKTVRKIAKTGVDYISVGALTHSVKALDISLNIL